MKPQHELKHYCTYLPYKVNIFIEGQMNELECSQLEYVYENQYQLVLHPPSDLTKEIEVNGEKFVPMVELLKYLYKRCHFEINKLKDISIDLENNEINYTHDLTKYSFYFTGHSFVSINVTDEDNPKVCQNDYDYELFQKLFEWHFDIFNLIKNGLAKEISYPKN